MAVAEEIQKCYTAMPDVMLHPRCSTIYVSCMKPKFYGVEI